MKTDDALLNGQLIFMTGATSGLGKVAAAELAAKGAHLIVACRNMEKGQALQQYVKQHFPDTTGSITLISCDLASFRSVSEACRTVISEYPKLDTVILNAGIMNFEFRESADGIEETLQVNLLSPLLMSHLLLPLLEKSPQAKLIFTASAFHQGFIHFSDPEFRESFSSYKSYRQSKLGIILLTRWLSTYLKATGVGVYCQHPGMVNTSLIQKGGIVARFISTFFGDTPEVGAQTLLYLARTAKANLSSGEYYADGKVKKTSSESYNMDTEAKLLAVCRAYLQSSRVYTSGIFPE